MATTYHERTGRAEPLAFTAQDLHAAVTKRSPRRPSRPGAKTNVGRGERKVSVVAGAILGAVGLYRKDLPGLALATLGGALLIRGASGHCSGYAALGIDTTKEDERRAPRSQPPRSNEVEAKVSYLIDKPASELYAIWRDFERLPEFMTHLKSVKKLDARRTHWTTSAPWLYGGEVEWTAEIVEDELNRRIAWRSEADADVENEGSIEFSPAPGSRGTYVRVSLAYRPPGGSLGRWAAKLFGEEPEQQIHEDLRNFKRLMEVGELPTTEGQPRGKCR